MKVLFAILGLMASSIAMAGPDYLDPQYQIQFKAYSDCVNPKVQALETYYEKLAILYPRFGIAFREMKQIVMNIPPDSTSMGDQAKQAHQQFVDRILRTAEPEALEDYNLAQSQFENNIRACGELPQPPMKP
jgi:hypothetical protein